MSRKWRLWSTLSGSVLLHGAVLCLVFVARPRAERDADATLETGSPFGGSQALESQTPVMLNAAAAELPAAIAVELDGTPVRDSPPPETVEPTRSKGADSPPDTAPDSAEVNKLLAEPATPTRLPTPTPQASKPSVRPLTPAPTVNRTESQPKAEEYAEGEDWLRLEDQADHQDSAAKPAGPKLDAKPQTPTTDQPSPAVDPLVARLLAAEARKARERRNLATQTTARRPAPAPPSPLVVEATTADASDPGITDLPVGLARWLSDVAYSAPEWDQIELGDMRLRVRVALQDGRVRRTELLGRVSKPLRRAIEAAFFHLRRRQFPGGTVHAPDAELELEIVMRVTQLSAKNAPRGAQTVQHLTTASGRYLPSFRVLRPSLREIVAEISIRR